MIELIEEKETQINTVISDSILVLTQELINYSLKELTNNNLDNAFRAVYAYLSLFDKSEYEFLVVDLIKLDLIQKDYTFNRLINILKDLSNKEYCFNEKEYIKCLYRCLKEKKLEEANVYLDILSKRNKELKYLEFDSKEESYKFYRQLSMTRIAVAAQTLEINYSKFLDSIRENEHYINRLELGNLVVTNPEKFIKFVNGKIFRKNEQYKDVNKELFQTKIAELKQGKDFVILGKMNNEQIDCAKQVIRQMPDVAYFIVGNGKIKTFAIKNRIPRNKQCIDFKALTLESQVAYDAGDYETCINLQKQILALDKPKAQTFAKIGLSYIKQGKIKTAIEYLSMATELSIQEGGNYDFGDLIESLNDGVDKDYQKTFITKKIKMKESDFTQEENYGIDNFNEIKILVFNGRSIIDICNQFNLTKEQTNIVKLLFARNYYLEENYIMGDFIIREVEQSNYKTPFIISLMNEIRRTKKFYKNRKTDDFIFVKKTNYSV